MRRTSRSWPALPLALFLCLLTQAGQSQDLTLRRAIELTLTHSSSIGLAEAERHRSGANYREARSVYTPQVTVGAGLGYAYGFPLSLEGSAPTVFNVASQSSLFNPSQREFIRAAEADWGASSSQSRDVRSKVLLDVVTSYIELNKWERKLPVLYAEKKVTADMLHAVDERVKEGVDAPLEETKTRLKAAQAGFGVAQAEGSANVLRQHLADLTGLPVSSISTVASSIPALPEPKEENNDTSPSLQGNPVVTAADLRANAEQFRARGEHKALYPSADAAMQYGLINTTLTDYAQFFRPGSFRENNVTVGVVIRLPLVNATQRARAEAADADALRAKEQAQLARTQVTGEIVRLQNAVRELTASRDVAQVQNELGQAELQAAQIRMQAKTATLRELQEASLQAVLDSGALMDSEFEAERAQLQLLYETGALAGWSEGAK